MLSALNREALLHVDMGNYEQAVAYGRQVDHVAHKLHIIMSGEQMQTTYNLLQEQSASKSKTKWLIWAGIAIAIVFLVVLIVLYYSRNERRHFRDMRRLVHVLDAYRRAVINGEPSTSPEVVAAIEELRSIPHAPDWYR